MRNRVLAIVYSLLVIFSVLMLNCFAFQKADSKPDLKEDGPTLLKKIEKSELPWQVFGKSVKEKNIHYLALGSGEETIIIFGGFHGDELLGARLVFQYAEYLATMDRVQPVRIVIVPVMNPDGLFLNTRTNANGVDINRNFPTENWKADSRSPRTNPGKAPASEPETRAVMKLLEKYPPNRIVSVHTPLKVVNYDGPGKLMAEAMAVHNQYPVSGDIGYPTPGSFGTFAGVEQNIPTVTLELPRGVSMADVWEANRNALNAAVNFKQKQ